MSAGHVLSRMNDGKCAKPLAMSDSADDENADDDDDTEVAADEAYEEYDDDEAGDGGPGDAEAPLVDVTTIIMASVSADVLLLDVADVDRLAALRGSSSKQRSSSCMRESLRLAWALRSSREQLVPFAAVRCTCRMGSYSYSWLW